MCQSPKNFVGYSLCIPNFLSLVAIFLFKVIFCEYFVVYYFGTINILKREQDKTDFENEKKTADFEVNKTGDFKVGQRRRFCKKKIAIKTVSLIKAFWPNYR